MTMIMSSNIPESMDPSSNFALDQDIDTTESSRSTSNSATNSATRRASDSSRRSMTNYGAAATPTSILSVDISEDLSEDNDIDDEMDNPVFSCPSEDLLLDFKNTDNDNKDDDVKAFSDLNDPYNLGSTNHSKQTKRFSSAQGIMDALKTPVRMAKTPVRLASKGFTEALGLSNKVGQGAIDLSGKVAGKSLSEAMKVSKEVINLSEKGMKKVSKSMQSLTTRKSSEDLQETPEKSDESESKANAVFDLRLSTTMEKRKLKIRRSFNEKDDEIGVRKCKSTGELTDIGGRSGLASGESSVRRKSNSRSKRASGLKSADSSPADGGSMPSRRQHRRKPNENAGLGSSGHSKRKSSNHSLSATSGHSKNSSSRGRKKASGGRGREREGRSRSVSVATGGRGRDGKGSRGRSHSVTATSRSTAKQPGRRERSHSVSTAARASTSGMPVNVFKIPPQPSAVTIFPVASNSETPARSKTSATGKVGSSAVSRRLSTTRRRGSGGGLPDHITSEGSATNLQTSIDQQLSSCPLDRQARQVNTGQLLSTGRQGSSRQVLVGTSKKTPVNRMSMDMLISGLSGHGQAQPAQAQPKEEPTIVEPQNGIETSLVTPLVLNASFASESSFASEQDDSGEGSENNYLNRKVELPAPLPMNPPNNPGPKTAPAKKSWKCTCGEDNCESFNFCGVCGSRPTPTTWNCASCDRKDNAARFKFCVGCGTPRQGNS